MSNSWKLKADRVCACVRSVWTVTFCPRSRFSGISM